VSVNPKWPLAAAGVLLFLFLASVTVIQRPASSFWGPGRHSEKRPRLTGARPGSSNQDAGPPKPQPRTPLPQLRRPHVVVEKSAHQLTVYDGDRPVRSYRAAVGSGKGDKVREGDRCTPEGRFIICVRNPKSQFTRALGLSYPNIEDARRGLRDGLITRPEHDAIVEAARQGRRPPWDTPLGGEIMIHGGGAGRDWTDGCIALADADILELYAALAVGTPVTILP